MHMPIQVSEETSLPDFPARYEKILAGNGRSIDLELWYQYTRI